MTLKISRILHAGYVFESKGVQIVFDPIFENPFSVNCYAFPDVKFDIDQIKQQNFQAIFISHFHDDHCSLQSLNLLNRKTPIFLYYQQEDIFNYIKELGFENVSSLQLNQKYNVGPFEITPHRALDFNVDSIFQIKVGNLNVLNVVDSLIADEDLSMLKSCGPWDMVLWPFQTLRESDVLAPRWATPGENIVPAEFVEQLKFLNPRYIVPSSCQFQHEPWSWYNQALFPISYGQFKKQINQDIPLANVIRLNPSVSVGLSKSGLSEEVPLSWVLPMGFQDVDYQFEPFLKAPSTSEIAKHFLALNDVELKVVEDYCNKGLIERYQTLDEPIDNYFRIKFNWQLKLYDHLGNSKSYFYEIYNSDIQLVSNHMLQINWFTEISIYKFFRALEYGETLTSLYLRINDYKFDESITKKIPLVDIMQDPLIRCLYENNLGSYQKAQLLNLQKISD